MHCSSWMLTLSSFACAAMAIGSLSLAVASDCWLITHEHSTLCADFPQDNATETVCMNVNVTARVGLWRYCTVSANIVSCLRLEYRLTVKKTPREDGQLASGVIAEAQMGATPFFLLGLLFALASGLFSILGNLNRNAKILIAAIFSIAAGLALGVGIIFYITFINDEASHTKPNNEGYYFKYKYGWSFYLVGVAFLASESSAVACVTLYLKRNGKPDDMIKIIPGLEEKIKLDEPEKVMTNYSTLIL